MSAVLACATLCATTPCGDNTTPETNDAVRATTPQSINLLKNGSFVMGMANWRYWQYALRNTNWVNMVTINGKTGTYRALRIADPDGSLVGVQQAVNVVSGKIYRLSGSVQSMATNSSAVLFGGRIFFRMAPQPEQQLLWTTEFNQWWPKDLVITNKVTGTALVIVHMGYGRQQSTGEFTAVCLERLN